MAGKLCPENSVARAPLPALGSLITAESCVSAVPPYVAVMHAPPVMLSLATARKTLSPTVLAAVVVKLSVVEAVLLAALPSCRTKATGGSIT